MKTKSITQYMSEQKPRSTLSVRIDSALKERTQKILKARSGNKKKVGWDDLIEACLQKFCDECEFGKWNG